MKYIHPLGSHSSVPFTPKFWLKEIQGEFWFLPQSKYDFGPGQADQMDWNKLCGVSFNPLKPNDNAIMIAWRYNTNLSLFEVSPYFNVNGTIVSFDKDQYRILRCVQFEPVQFKVDYWGVGFKLKDEKSWYLCPKPAGLKTNKWTSFRIQPWFGGNRITPNQVELIINFK